MLWGFQLWVNLPKVQKLTEPRYQDIPPEDIPEVEPDSGLRIRVIAGSSNGVDGAVKGIATAPLYLDISMPADTTVEQPVTEGHNAFIYMFGGEVHVGRTDSTAGALVDRGHLAVLSDGDAVALAVEGSEARFLLVAARPLNEPIVRHGPFVMNTREEIMEAIRDFQSGRF